MMNRLAKVNIQAAVTCRIPFVISQKNELPNKTIEVSSMYYKTRRKSSYYGLVDLKFNTILKNLNIPNFGKHDALNDAIMTSIIFLKLISINP